VNRILSRRNLLKFSAGIIGTGIVTAGLGSELVFPQKAVAKDELTPEQALQELMQGNDRFVKRKRKIPIKLLLVW
jgi:carbonic anhydrase